MKQLAPTSDYRPRPDIGARCGADCEDPWDILGPLKHRPRVVAVTITWRQALLPLLVGLLLWLTIFGTARGQSAPPPVEEPEATDRPYQRSMSREAYDLARDYLDLLEQVRYLNEDYQQYYQEMASRRAEVYLAQLSEASQVWLAAAARSDYAEILKQLSEWEDRLAQDETALRPSRGTAATPPQRTAEAIADELEYQQQELKILKQDMDELRVELDRSSDAEPAQEMQKVEAAIAAANDRIRALQSGHEGAGRDNETDLSLYRVTRSLRRELAAVRLLYENDIYPRLESDDAVRDAISSYVRQAVAQRANKDAERRIIETVLLAPGVSPDEIQIVDLDMDSLLVSLKADPPPVGELPEPPRVYSVTVDKPAVDIGPRQLHFRNSQGTFVTVKEHRDSIRIIDSNVPVYIVNPIGGLVVEGWDRDYLLAECELEVGADSENKAQTLVERMNVRLYERRDAVYVEASAPELVDPMIRVNRSLVRIKTPRHNRVVIKSGFGDIGISHLSGGLQLSSSNAALTIDHIEGGAEIASSMGRVDLSHVNGPMTVSNAYQPLTLTDCLGTMQVENVRAEVSLENCGGQANVRNTGHILISGFVGDVDVQNSNGPVELLDIEGNVTASNSMQPIVVRGVSGSANIENLRAKVEAFDVQGRLSASNLVAPIIVSASGGPVLLSNRKGDIELTLTQLLHGASRVSSQGGTVRLRLAAEIDLLLTIEAVGGNITSVLPIKIKQEGETQSARLALGASNNTLAISATNSNVDVLYQR
ncbi:MAG: hypothetical protein ABIE70_08510 [bacterium]